MFLKDSPPVITDIKSAYLTSVDVKRKTQKLLTLKRLKVAVRYISSFLVFALSVFAMVINTLNSTDTYVVKVWGTKCMDVLARLKIDVSPLAEKIGFNSHILSIYAILSAPVLIICLINIFVLVDALLTARSKVLSFGSVCPSDREKTAFRAVANYAKALENANRFSTFLKGSFMGADTHEKMATVMTIVESVLAFIAAVVTLIIGRNVTIYTFYIYVLIAALPVLYKVIFVKGFNTIDVKFNDYKLTVEYALKEAKRELSKEFPYDRYDIINREMFTAHCSIEKHRATVEGMNKATLAANIISMFIFLAISIGSVVVVNGDFDAVGQSVYDFLKENIIDVSTIGIFAQAEKWQSSIIAVMFALLILPIFIKLVTYFSALVLQRGDKHLDMIDLNRYLNTDKPVVLLNSFSDYLGNYAKVKYSSKGTIFMTIVIFCVSLGSMVFLHQSVKIILLYSLLYALTYKVFTYILSLGNVIPCILMKLTIRRKNIVMPNEIPQFLK